MIFGKSVTAGAPFAHLSHLRAGDHLSVTTAQGAFDFVVLGQRHEGEPLPILPPSRSMVTLVTASGSGLFGALSPTSLLYVDAALNGNAVRAPAGRPTTVAFDELQGQGESGAVFAVIIWLLLLAVVAVGAVLLVERWGLGRSWLLVAPVVLSVLWGLSTNVLRLLPNVY
jgi:sortase A